MRRRLWAMALAAVLALGALPGAPAPARAASQGNEDRPKIYLEQLVWPDRAVAGARVAVRVRVDASGEAGICCGRLLLEGPAGQELTVELLRTADGELAGEWAISPHIMPGPWKVRNLKLTANNWKRVQVMPSEEDRVLHILPSGDPVDQEPPQLLAVSAPEAAVPGEPYAIAVRASDPLSGIASVTLTVRPDGGAEMSWTEYVTAAPAADPQSYEGVMMMSVLPEGSALRVVGVTLEDRAGNRVYWDREKLAEAGFEAATAAAPLEVPEGLRVSPYLDLIHPGRLNFARWLEADRAYLLGLVQRVNDDPADVRERMLAELPQLRAALEGLRGEVYTDPESGLRAAPYATTGKWMVLEQALLVRTYVLTLAGVPEETRTERVIDLASQWLQRTYQVVDEDDELLSLEGGDGERAAQEAAAYLRAMALSPELVATLQVQGYREADAPVYLERDPNLVYFTPVRRRGRPFIHVRGRAMLEIPAFEDDSMEDNLFSVFYQTGKHLGEAFLSSTRDPQRGARWAPYSDLRGVRWPEEDVRENPMENLALDFTRVFLPRGAGYDFRAQQSVPHLEPGSEADRAFRKWVTALLAQPPVHPEVTPQGYVQVGTNERFTVEVKGERPAASLLALAEAWRGIPIDEPVTARSEPGRLLFRGRYAAVGKTYLYRLTTRDERGREDVHWYLYAQVPALLEPIPAATGAEVVTITGSTVPNRAVRIGSVQSRSSESGRFRLQVPLKEGANHLRLTVEGQEHGARLTIHRMKAGAPVPLTVQVLRLVRGERLSVSVQTAPHAIVTVNGLAYQADGAGALPLDLPVEEAGEYALLVEATDAVGNTASHEQTVPVSLFPRISFDSAPGRVRTGTAVISGRVERAEALLLDGQEVPLDGDGRFSVTLMLQPGEVREVAFEAIGEQGRTLYRWRIERQ